MKVEEITEILNRPAGSILTYHVGHLAVDRAAHRIEGPGIVERTTAERDAINDIAILAARFAAQGLVSLVQKRLGPHSYQYMAQRLAKEAKQPLKAAA